MNEIEKLKEASWNLCRTLEECIKDDKRFCEEVRLELEKCNWEALCMKNTINHIFGEYEMNNWENDELSIEYSRSWGTLDEDNISPYEDLNDEELEKLRQEKLYPQPSMETYCLSWANFV